MSREEIPWGKMSDATLISTALLAVVDALLITQHGPHAENYRSAESELRRRAAWDSATHEERERMIRET